MDKLKVFERITNESLETVRFCSEYNEELWRSIAAELYAKGELQYREYTGYLPLLYYLMYKKHEGNKQFLASLYFQELCWRKSKVFYTFDEELEREINNSDISLSMKVPASLLNKCPYSSFYVQTKDEKMKDDEEAGFFASITPYYRYDAKHSAFFSTKEKVLDITMYSLRNRTERLTSSGISMKIPGEGSEATIEDSLIFMRYETSPHREKRKHLDEELALCALQYILHLCSQNSDIVPVSLPKVPSWASKKKKALNNIRVFNVSCQDGPTERDFPAHNTNKRAVSTGTGKSKAPHTRRAHWAYRWVGKKEERQLELRWIREAYIHAEAEQVNGAIVNTKRNT